MTNALQSDGLDGDLRTYTIGSDAVRVRLALPWSEAEVEALEKFLALSPQERTAALTLAFCKDQDAEFLASLKEDYPGLAERMRLGSGVKAKTPPEKDKSPG